MKDKEHEKRQKLKLRRISPMPLAYVIGLFYVAIGILEGVIFVVVTNLVPTSADGSAAASTVDSMIGNGMGYWALLAFPIMFGVFGFITGWLSAVLYNFISDRLWSLEFEFE